MSKKLETVKKKLFSESLQKFRTVFPVKGKKPICKWKTLTSTPKITYDSSYGLAAPTGKMNDFWCLDIDNHKTDNKKLQGQLLELIDSLKELDIPYQTTRNGGYHFFFKYDNSIPNKINVGGTHIDILNDNRYVVFHGEGYATICGDIDTLPVFDKIKYSLLDLYINQDKFLNYFSKPKEDGLCDKIFGDRLPLEKIKEHCDTWDMKDTVQWKKFTSAMVDQYLKHEKNSEIKKLWDTASKKEKNVYDKKRNFEIWSNNEKHECYFKFHDKKESDVLIAINDGQLGIANFYYNRRKEDIILASETRMFKFDEETCLWNECTKNDIISDIARVLTSELKKLIGDALKESKHKESLALTRTLVSVTKHLNLNGVFVHVSSDTCFKIKDSDTIINSNRNLISFKNGVYDLKNNEFRQRTRKDYCSFSLGYDYNNEINNTIMDEIKNILLNICNDDQEYFTFMMDWLGYCLTGETREQKTLFMIGHTASNGKSTIAHIFNLIFDAYSMKLDRRTFNSNYSKSHKQLAGIKYKRFLYIEELERSNLNVELLKDIVDGKNIENEVMYGTSENIQIYGKLNLISNHDPIFKSDEGVKRRGLCMIFKNKFVEKYDFEETHKGVYLLDPKLISKFENDDYKVQFINLLLPHAHRYYNKGLQIPVPIRKQFKDIANENDEMGEFLTNHCIITNNDDDRVLKTEFTDMYNSKFKTNHKFHFLLSDLKNKGILFDRTKRKDGIKGCLVGLKLKNNLFVDGDNYDVDDISEYSDTASSSAEPLKIGKRNILDYK